MREKCVWVLPSLRVHMANKVASASLGKALGGTRLDIGRAYPDAESEDYRFQVIRHPLDRLVSCYRFFVEQETKLHQINQMGIRPGISFEQFLELALDRHLENPHLWPQAFSSGPFKEEINYCKLEELELAWQDLRTRFLYLISLPKLNETEKSCHWSQYYKNSSRLKKQAEEIFAEDLELYEKAPTWAN